MKRILAVLTLLAVGCTLLVGCGDEAAKKRIAARKELEPALTKVRLAALTADPTKTGENLERQKRLDEAAQELVKLAGNADGAQRSEVFDLLAQVEQTRSQDIMRQARAAWAALANTQVRLLSDLDALGGADVRVATYTVPNTNDLTGLQKYVDDLGMQAKATDDQIKTLTTQIDAREREKAARISERDAAKKQWQTVMDQAAVKQGQDQLDLYNQAVSLQAKADVAATAADLVDANLSGMKSEKALLQQKLALAQAAQKEAQGQIAEITERNKNFQMARADAAGETTQPAGTSRAALLKDFDATFKKLDADYLANVEKLLDEALARASAAVDHVQQAENFAGDAAAKRTFKTMRLAAAGNLASLATQNIVIVGQYARLLQKAAALAGNLKIDQAPVLNEAVARVTKKQGDLVKSAEGKIGDAVKLAATVSTTATDDPAMRQAGHLRDYTEMIAKANISGEKIEPLPEVPAPSTPAPSTPAPARTPATTRPARGA